MTGATDDGPAGCHVVNHVHWDREWYRPWEQFRARLVELVEQVCDRLDDGSMESFHLDGQTITIADVAEIRPDLVTRVGDHVTAGRLTVGPWHVLADNQLVTAECLVRNLMRGRRWGTQVGGIAAIGYSPDAFGHPADLPRLLQGFGIDTALVWRGAPPGAARFRWSSPDGTEVFAVNQRYHEAEVLWDNASAPSALASFLDGELQRSPGGPWLLLNGGDHLMPVMPNSRLTGIDAPVPVRESTLEQFFAAAREPATDLPLVTGELRTLGDHLTFLLPGTLSARTYLKQANDAMLTALERFADPAVARARLIGSGSARDLYPLVDHGWELAIENSPHDSICGCSVDEVHRTNMGRARSAIDICEHVVTRALLDHGWDTRHGSAPERDAAFVVVSGHCDVAGGPVELDLLTAPDVGPVEVLGPDDRPVPFDVVDLGREKVFEADLDLLPDSVDTRRYRIGIAARGVPAWGWADYRVRLGAGSDSSGTRQVSEGRSATFDGWRIDVADNATLTVTDLQSGRVHPGLGRISDDGDRGDTYNYDPPPFDTTVEPVVDDVRAEVSDVRLRLVIRARMGLPARLTDDRSARADGLVDTPVELTVQRWAGMPELRWTIRFTNEVTDHRMRFHVPVGTAADSWVADQHWSTIERPFRPDLGELPAEAGYEAEYAAAPVHSFARAGEIAVLTRGLPEVQGLAERGEHELAVTLVRSVGWLSRFDLASRTAGAGPMFATPEAQCLGPFEGHVAVRLSGEDLMSTAIAAADHRGPMRGYQLRRTETGTAPGDPVRVTGAMATMMPAESSDGVLVRVWNPTADRRRATVHLPADVTVTETRLDETPVAPVESASRAHEVDLAPYAVRTFHLNPAS